MTMAHINNGSYTAINWNNIEDELDKATWEKLTQQFWLDTRIPISNDLRTWRGNMSEQERQTMNLVFGGLTTLDTLQSQDGMAQLKLDATNQKEEAVLNNIQFMESVHAKSYSSIFETLNEKVEIEKIFEWADSNEFLQYKANRINDIYHNGSALQKKIASVFLETFLFYSGFYTPLYFLGHNKMLNVAEIIKLMLYELYENEEKYTHELYDDLGWTEQVLTFLRYNANKALMNLGQEPMFPDGAEDVNPVVMNGISTSTANHDFFSGVGNGYLLGEVEAMNDDDYNIGLE